jgi:hypothetical protein
MQTLYCPRCGQPTTSLKYFSVPFLVFAFIQIGWGEHKVVACPHCMRKYLVLQALFSLVAANVLSPIVLFFYLLLFAETAPEGHSASILPHLAAYQNPPNGPLAHDPGTHVNLQRLALCLGILLLVGGGIVVLASVVGKPQPQPFPTEREEEPPFFMPPMKQQPLDSPKLKRAMEEFLEKRTKKEETGPEKP